MSSQFLISYQLKFNVAKKVNYEFFQKNLDEEAICGYYYKVQARCLGHYHKRPYDCSVIKQVLVDEIKTHCDHALIININDELFKESLSQDLRLKFYKNDLWTGPNVWSGVTKLGKTYAVPFEPSSEELARFWYFLLVDKISKITENYLTLHKIRVYETDNWFVEYKN